MKWVRKVRFILWLGLILAFWSCQQAKNSLFVSLSPAATGIDFSNELTYTDSLTVLEFEYMYNGAGVAVGDINNDGLQDLYFTGNMVSGKLYLNKGEFKFEDITKQAGVGTTGWSNGVSLVDINQDGFKDIYICKGGPRGSSPQSRANLLFINNGDATFTESAADYGLDDNEFSVQAAFFDYDRDGDLDVYLLSNALVDFNRNTSRPKDRSGKAPSIDKLFQNNGDLTFSEVTSEAGIVIEGFGLGVEVCDINEDQWPDLYISNDFLTNDLLYINNQDGTFTNEVASYLKHQTYNGMGNDLADFNNDGLIDIAVLDMLPEDNRRRKLTMMGNNYDEFQQGLSYGYEPQYVRNTLQLNNGGGSFSEIGQMAGIAATDWSWSALFADYDNDGLKDLLITNGYRQDITNLDFMVYGNQELTMGTPEANKIKRLEALNELPGIKLHNYIYRNKGDLTFSDQSEQWGLSEPSYSNGAVYADLDNDGDLDLVINNIDDPATIYRNRLKEKEGEASTANFLRIGFEGPKGNREGLGTKVYLHYQGQQQYQYFTTVRGYLSTVESYLHFGLAGIETVDSIEVIWPDGRYHLLENVAPNQVLTLKYQEAGPAQDRSGTIPKATLFNLTDSLSGLGYQHQENNYVDFKVQPLLPHMHSKAGPGLAVGDINGDSLEDFYIGGASGHKGKFFLQQGEGQFISDSLGGDWEFEDMGVLLLDADRDTDLDLYVVSGGSAQPADSPWYQDRLYLNDGAGNFSKCQSCLPRITASGSSAVAADYDRDGDIDLFVGGRVVPGDYPSAPKSYLLRNDSQNGNTKFTDITPKELSEIGMVTSALWTDYDNDGWIDLMLVGEFMPITFFSNEQGTIQNSSFKIQNSSGWWNSLVGGDFDADGDIDYLAGNLGLNSRYHASPEEPLCIYTKDYDKNGRKDPVMCYYNHGKNYIAHSRDDLIGQINAMRARFRTYDEYASATFESSFLPEELADASIVKSDNFESTYIENLGDGKFSIKPLPMAAQIAPIYGMVADDYDLDGWLDVLLVGNSYATEASVGRYDASVGMYLRGDGTGNFAPLDLEESGFMADGDAKGMVQLLNADGNRQILVGINSEGMKSFKEDESATFIIRAQPDDAYVEFILKDGRKYKHEFYYGSTYLSQSSRLVTIPENVKSIMIHDFLGEGRSYKESE